MNISEQRHAELVARRHHEGIAPLPLPRSKAGTVPAADLEASVEDLLERTWRYVEALEQENRRLKIERDVARRDLADGMPPWLRVAATRLCEECGNQIALDDPPRTKLCRGCRTQHKEKHNVVSHANRDRRAGLLPRSPVKLCAECPNTFPRLGHEHKRLCDDCKHRHAQQWHAEGYQRQVDLKRRGAAVQDIAAAGRIGSG